MRKLSKLLTIGLLSVSLASALSFYYPNPDCSICQGYVDQGIEIPGHFCDDFLKPIN